MLSLHRMPSLLVKFRTMQINKLRGLLYEFGVTFCAVRVAGLDEIRERMAELEDALPLSIVLNLLVARCINHGFETFSRRSVAELRLCVGRACARICLLAPATFAAQTGCSAPGPLDESGGY